MPLTDDERQRADDFLANLEKEVGQLNTREGNNAAIVKAMIWNLNALRSLLGVVRPH